MSNSYPLPDDGLLDLLADAIASGHEPDSTQSESGVLSQFSDADVYEFEQAAAAVACACASSAAEQLPDSVRLRCSGAARAVATGGGSAMRAPAPAPARPAPLRFVQHTTADRPRGGRSVALGWMAAAACLAIAAMSWWPGGAVGPTAAASLSPQQQMESLVATSDDLTRWDWTPWDDSYDGVTGEVVWSESAQEGYLVLAGMPANDPSAEQYQVWVIESSRGTPLEVPPVDGGVFDVSDADEVIVPIKCAIPASGVVAFAVTVEQPGGVVVSDQSRKTVIAQAPRQG